MLVSIQACTSGQVRKSHSTKVWLIDAESVSLFRVFGPGQEEVIPISQNQDAMDKFMCMDSNDVDLKAEEYME